MGHCWMLLLYLFHLIGLVWTRNMDFAGLDHGHQGPLLVFPLSFFSVDLSARWGRSIAGSYSPVLAVLIAHRSAHSASIYLPRWPGRNHAAFALSTPFFSSEFSLFIHPTYGVYLTWALTFVEPDAVGRKSRWNIQLVYSFGYRALCQ